MSRNEEQLLAERRVEEALIYALTALDAPPACLGDWLVIVELATAEVPDPDEPDVPENYFLGIYGSGVMSRERAMQLLTDARRVARRDDE